MPATHTKDVLHKFLKPGMKLSINFEFGPKDKFSYSTVYLGIKENSYLILDIPMRLLEDQVMRKLHNADVIVRGVSDTELGHVLAFKSSVLMTAVRPSLCSLFAYPVRLQLSLLESTSVTSYKWTVPSITAAIFMTAVWLIFHWQASVFRPLLSLSLRLETEFRWYHLLAFI